MNRFSFNALFDRMTRTKIFLVILTISGIAVFASYRFRKEENRQQLLMGMLVDGVKSQHYNPAPIDDKYSEKVYDLFLSDIDRDKKFFTAEDIRTFQQMRDSIDDQVNNSSYRFFDVVNETYQKRVKLVTSYYKPILDKPFDFKVDEYFALNGKKIPYSPDTAGLHDQWRKLLKYETLERLNGMIESQQKLKEKKDTAYHEKSYEQMEKEAREKVKKSNDEYFKRVNEVNKDDWFNIYLNTLVNVQDPHTEYFAPVEKQNFDITMTGQLQGIGAQLQEKDGEIKVTNIIPGGPAYKDGHLKAGDIILKVAQEGQEPVEISEMRLDKAVQLIRGKKGTSVTLTIKKPDATQQQVTLVRDIVIIEETYAQSAIIDGKEKIGYIRLPGFYADFGNNGGRDCADDVRKELVKLKEEKVDGVILDLRDNGGGSLESVVRMVGLFIKTGPVVQVKTRTGSAQVMSDNDPSVTYDGPLVVMVNENSASASEILAAAIQDYKRGIIIGSTTTFGKGTVQRMFSLDDMLNSSYSAIKPLGSLKITMQKFYRVSGGSTQLRGVTPDIVTPDVYGMIKYGEKEEEYPMQWDEIPAASYEKLNNNTLFDKASASSRKRIDENKIFAVIKDEEVDMKKESEENMMPLSLEKFQLKMKRNKDQEKTIKDIQATITPLNVYNMKVDAAVISTADSSKINRNKEWLKFLSKDVYVQEADNVVMDLRTGSLASKQEH